MKRVLLAVLVSCPLLLRGAEFSFTVLPNAAIRYRGEGKVIPQSYTQHFDGESSPLYRLEWRQDRSDKGYWGWALVHTGVFGGGSYAGELVPDLSAGVYQTDQMNVGFTNVQLSYRHPLADFPRVEALAELTVAREIFKRREFTVQGVSGAGLDDVNEMSAEGLGLGLGGLHGDRVTLRWEVAASHLVQIFDAKTDASAGQLFRAEAALGLPLGGGFSLEAGGLWQYWFLLGQGNRRLEVAGTQGAVISWNRQETRASGLFLSLRRTFAPSPN